MHVPATDVRTARAAAADEPGTLPARMSSFCVYAMDTSALNMPGSWRWRVTKKGRMPGAPTVLKGPGGTSPSTASGVAPRVARPAVTRVATAFDENATVTSAVGSEAGWPPPASTVPAKNASRASSTDAWRMLASLARLVRHGQDQNRTHAATNESR